jgi:hypothetical protein
MKEGDESPGQSDLHLPLHCALIRNDLAGDGVHVERNGLIAGRAHFNLMMSRERISRWRKMRQRPDACKGVTEGDVIVIREVGGLHDRYERRAARGHRLRRARQSCLTCARTHVPSERSGLPIIVIIGAINSRDVAIVTGNSAAPVLAQDRFYSHWSSSMPSPSSSGAELPFGTTHFTRRIGELPKSQPRPRLTT